VDQVAQLQDVGISLGGRDILRHVDLTLAAGGSLGIVGPNGSGKTTLVRALATLTSIDHGRLMLFGSEVTTRTVLEMRRSIGLIGHHPALIPELTLHENLIHVARLASIDTDRVFKAIQVVGLEEAADRRATASSFGMRRRTEIARLLLTKPRLLLLDEAASGLDESARELIAALVESVRIRDGSVVVVSHDRSQLDRLTDSVLGLERGRLESVI
jgi:ABC-type multidrug transport system ATPase subunit